MAPQFTAEVACYRVHPRDYRLGFCPGVVVCVGIDIVRKNIVITIDDKFNTGNVDAIGLEETLVALNDGMRESRDDFELRLVYLGRRAVGVVDLAIVSRA